MDRENPIYWQVMPSEMKLAEIIKTNPPTFEYSCDFFVHLLHLTIEIPAKNKDLRRKDGYVPLNSTILQDKNRKYHQHLKYLVDNKVLEIRPHYTPGSKSRMYRISEAHLKDNLMELMVSDKNLIKHLAKQYHLDLKTGKKYRYLQQWLNDKLQVDDEAAMKYCIGLIKQAPYSEIYQIHQQAYGKMFMIKMMKHKQYWFKVDKFGHRLHTNFTNLSKDIRQFVKYDKQNLVSIDIRNSQPYFGIKLLNEKYPNLLTTNNPETEQSQPPTNTSVPIILVKSPEGLVPIDVQLYTRLASGGKIYEYLETEMRKAIGDSYFTREYIFDLGKREVVKNEKTPRQMVKDVTYQVFFSKNSWSTPEKELFAKLFPTVMKVFTSFKGNKHVAIDKRHKMLAQQLQRLESYVMLDKVAKEISRLYPDIPLFTVHDSIVTTVGNENIVQAAMEKIISAEMGVKPELKLEYWGTKAEMKKAA